MIYCRDYNNKDMVNRLCEQIHMPEEAASQISYIICNCDFMPIYESFHKLFDIKKSHEAFEAIESFCGKEYNGLKSLTVYLMAALHTKEIYNEKGIDEKIYIETMKMFTRFVNEHMYSFDIYGFDRGFWIYRILAANLFRLGELEYEMCCLKRDCIGYIKEGDNVLSVHIPSDAVLTRDKLDESYCMAYRFFEKYYKEFIYEYFYTNTWLLSKELKKLLPNTSRILTFQSDYEIIGTNIDDDSFMEWVYKKKYDNINELAENTSLQKNIKKQLLDNGKIGSCRGIIRKSVFQMQ